MYEFFFTESAGFAPPRGKSEQFAEGILRIRRIPDSWTEEEYRYWWCPETSKHGHILRPARISEREKQEYELAAFSNQIMVAGRSQVLTFIGSSSGTTSPFTQYFAVGTGTITATNPGDISLANEVFRKQPTTFSVAGTQVDINVQFGTTDAQFTYTNAGIWGISATSTLGSGTLMTHALCSFTKGAIAISIDYLINLL